MRSQRSGVGTLVAAMAALFVAQSNAGEQAATNSIPSLAPAVSHDIKIFSGEKRLIGTYGPSTSMGYPSRLQRKLYRYTGKNGADCPLQISNFSVPGAQWRMPGWIDCRSSKDDPAKWEAFRSDRYTNTVLKLIKDHAGTPVIVLAMNNTGYACIKDQRILGPDDKVHIDRTITFLRTHIHAILADGAALYFLSPKKYWRELDDPNEWNRNEERYGLTQVASENIPGCEQVLPGDAGT